MSFNVRLGPAHVSERSLGGSGHSHTYAHPEAVAPENGKLLGGGKEVVSPEAACEDLEGVGGQLSISRGGNGTSG